MFNLRKLTVKFKSRDRHTLNQFKNLKYKYMYSNFDFDFHNLLIDG